MQCFTAFRTLGASARHHVKNAAHHLVAHHVHRAHHVIAHSVIGPVPIPAMVCILTGLAALGVGALVAEGMSFAPPASKEVTPAVSTLAPNVPSEIGSLFASLSSFNPTEIASLPVPPSSFDWNELGSSPVPSSSFDWNEVDSLPDSPYSFDTSGPSSVPIPSGQPAAVPEPTSFLALVTSLLGLATLPQYNKAVRGRRRAQAGFGCRPAQHHSPGLLFWVTRLHPRSSGKSVNAETV